MINLNTFTKYNKRNYLSDDWVKNLVEILSFVYCFLCVVFLAAANVKMNFSINERSTHSLVMVLLLLFVGLFFFEMSSYNILIISDKKQAISKQIQISICTYQVMRGIIWYIYIYVSFQWITCVCVHL